MRQAQTPVGRVAREPAGRARTAPLIDPATATTSAWSPTTPTPSSELTRATLALF